MPLLFLILSSFAFAAPAGLPSGEHAESNCRVKITTTYRNNSSGEEVHSFRFATEKECSEAADLFRENFSPKDVAAKKVSFSWEGR